MNEVILKGRIRDITSSHVVNGVEYDKANFIVPRKDGKEDILLIKFKKFSNLFKDGDKIEFVGNLRSYSRKINDNKSQVQLYVFTYFNPPSTNTETYEETYNKVKLDGRICKIDKLITTTSGKSNIHFIIANNIISGNNKINNYIPSVAWGKLALSLTDLKVSDKVEVEGELHSRTYKKVLENGEIEFRTAHELIVTNLIKLNEEDI